VSMSVLICFTGRCADRRCYYSVLCVVRTGRCSTRVCVCKALYILYSCFTSINNKNIELPSGGFFLP
jgi:hypothetical protein